MNRILLFICVVCAIAWQQASPAFGQCGEAPLVVELFHPENPAHPSHAAPLTHEPESTFRLELDRPSFDRIRSERPTEWSLVLADPAGGKWQLDWERFSAYKPDFKIQRMTQDGAIREDYAPKLLSYSLKSEEASGALILMENEVTGTFKVRGVGYEIARLEDGSYALFPLADANHGLSFSCGVDQLRDHAVAQAKSPGSRNNLFAECVEVALDVDFYTFGLFGSNCQPAVEWALAILSGVHVIYDAELGNLLDLQATYVNVWEVSDPAASVSNNGGGVLDAFRVEWTTNPALATIPRDITHMLTRRTNTGTGGIAYVDVTCWQDYAFGMSSYLNGGNTYIPGTYAWNLNVVAHELGHNFGSNHTHWCGWSTGPIDNCYDLEGSCGGYTNNPTAQVGTIMSYCHAISGGSVNLEFHPTVESEALLPTISADGGCFGGCATFTSSCAYYGCTDPDACNFSSEAVEDDGSCTVLDSCGICGGDGTACIGCSDVSACNYSELVTTDDGSCFYGPAGTSCACGDSIVLVETLSGSDTLTVTVDGSGYISTLAVTLDFTYFNDFSWASEVVFYMESPDGECIEIGGYDNNFGCAGTTSWPAAWAVSTPGTYTATVTLFEPIGGIGTWTFGIGNGWSSSTNAGYELTVVPDQFCAFELVDGCTDVDACNYDAAATVDDGSCELPPCGDCPADLNGDGLVSIGDVLIILSDFGCTSGCAGDTNGDGTTNISDLLVLLSAFGEAC